MIKYKDYYVYIHRRKTTGEVFYIGKGKNRRAFDRYSRRPYWHRVVDKHGLIVEIVLDGLQEWYALELEQDLIAYYGRLDLGLGTLVNFTDGGESNSGKIISQKTRDILSKQRTGRLLSDETKKKISDSIKGVPTPKHVRKKMSESAFNTMTDERKKILSDAAILSSDKRSERMKLNNPRSDNELYSFIRVDKSEIFIGTRRDFKRKYSFSIDKLFGSSRQLSSKGWKLLVDKATKIFNSDPKIYKFYHKEHGEFTGTRVELQNKYKIKITHMFDGRGSKYVLGWELLDD